MGVNADAYFGSAVTAPTAGASSKYSPAFEQHLRRTGAVAERRSRHVTPSHKAEVQTPSPYANFGKRRHPQSSGTPHAQGIDASHGMTHSS